jgi:hypothetical protein
MKKPGRPTFRIFETRAAEEYMKILSDALSLGRPASTSYPALLTSGHPLNAESKRKGKGGRGSKAQRVINLDYIGMAASSLLDKEGKHTPNTHYEQLDELLSSLDRLNERGVVLRMRLLLQYPYSLAGQNRILAEQWKRRSFMGDANGSVRDETKLAPALRDKDIEGSTFVQNQQYCLQNLQDLLSSYEVKAPNRIEVRFASISTLICGLRVNSLFFYDPYHYGRLKSENACAMNSTPVIMIDGADRNAAYEAFCNHFRYIWECDSTLDYDDVVERPAELSTIYIRKPEQLQTASKVERLRNSPAGGRNKVDWELRSRQFLQVINSICPIVAPADDPEVGFLAAPWEQKRTGLSDLCEPALMLEDFFKRGFEKVPDIRVGVLRSELGASLSSSLFNMMNSSTFSVVVLTKETAEGYCKPNVYIELGYLLHKNKGRRTFIVAEKGVVVPTDIADITILHFERTSPQSREEMEVIYKQLLQSMAHNGVISSTTLDIINRGVS